MENTIYGLFMEKVLQQPKATAIIENKRTLSFKELSAMVDMIADSFPDNTRAVGIVMRHRAEMIASILAFRFLIMRPTMEEISALVKGL